MGLELGLGFGFGLGLGFGFGLGLGLAPAELGEHGVARGGERAYLHSQRA